MAYNKVTYGGKTLIDLSGDTVSRESLLEGYVAHDKTGNRIYGNMRDRSIPYQPQLYTLNTSANSTRMSGFIVDVSNISELCVSNVQQGGSVSTINGSDRKYDEISSFREILDTTTHTLSRLCQWSNSKNDTSNKNWAQIIDVSEYNTILIWGGGAWGAFLLGTTDGTLINKIWAYSDSSSGSAYASLCRYVPAGYTINYDDLNKDAGKLLIDQHKEFRIGSGNYTKCIGHRIEPKVLSNGEVSGIVPGKSYSFFKYGRYIWFSAASNSANNNLNLKTYLGW